jgi:iron(III) transport system substrate-binding protein
MRIWTVILLLLLAGCSSSTDAGKVTLMIYSPHGKELLTEFEKRFEAQNSNIDVRWLDMGSQDALDRVRSEKSNPQADIWWGAPSTMFSQAEQEGLLEPFRPSWADKVDVDAHSAQDFWYGTFQTPEVIAYNTAAVQASDAPKEWDDLLDPKWKGKIVIRDPLPSGGMRAIFSAMIMRAMGPDGNPQPGYEWLRKLSANTKEYVINQALLIQKLVRQEEVITVWNMPDIELQKVQYKYPLEWVVPKSGTPVITDGMAIVKGTRRRKEAETFYEFVNSPDSLAFSAMQFYRIPTRTDIAREKLPEWMQNLNIPKMQFDQKTIELHEKEWMDYWDSNIRGASNP